MDRKKLISHRISKKDLQDLASREKIRDMIYERNMKELTAMLQKHGIKVIGNKVKVSDVRKALAAVSLPENDSDLTKKEVVKMLYLASGWVGRQKYIPNMKGVESQLEKIALMVNDAADND